MSGDERQVLKGMSAATARVWRSLPAALCEGLTVNKQRGDGMGDIQVPDSEDIEWQQTMLRRLDEELEKLELWIPDDDGQEILEEAQRIVTALREYSGF